MSAAAKLASERKTKERKAKYYLANRARIQAQSAATYQKQLCDVERHLTRRFCSTRARARGKGLAFTLDKQELIDRLNRTGRRCERTGIPFTADPTPRNPWQISIDRIDPAAGYTPDNVQLVVLIYNMAKNDSTDDDVLRFAQELLENSR